MNECNIHGKYDNKYICPKCYIEENYIKNMKFPSNKYGIILADPPWDYNDKGCIGNANRYYKAMSLKEVCNLPVKYISDENCLLFLWATYPKLPDALEVIKAWGFTYKSIAFQWIKLNKNNKYFFGLGRWTRGNTEPCLLATKGKPQRQSASVSQIIKSIRRSHSQKPDEQYRKIIDLGGNLKKIELFARDKKEGWDCWGNEIIGD